MFVLMSEHWMHSMDGEETLALAWSCGLALTLPIYLLFGSTRYATMASRWAFGVAVAAHLACQLIAVSLMRGHDTHGFAGTFVTLAGIAAVAVPAWTAWRQRVLRLQIMAR